jgi:SAM-dependent methyltransferase
MNEFLEKLTNRFGYNEVIRNSCLDPALRVHGNAGEILWKFVNRKPTEVILEIGTFRGLSTAYLAQFVRKIYTIDVIDEPLKYDIWDYLGVRDKIVFLKVDSEEMKKAIISNLKFDLAFVDGEHFDPYPEGDFNLVKHCGRVIMHDYVKEFPDVIRFVDTLESKEIVGCFVYWEDSLNVDTVLRPEFNRNVDYVDKYIVGKGIDMGCGSCPLLRADCLHVDISPQPVKDNFIQTDAFNFLQDDEVDYIFSSHMVEDLGSKELVIECINRWSLMLKPGGHLILLLPDMQGGRYPKVGDEGGNPSHRVDVGVEFINGIIPNLKMLEMIQIDTIPHDQGCTFDVVFRRK